MPSRGLAEERATKKMLTDDHEEETRGRAEKVSVHFFN